MNSSTNPVLVEVWRGGVLESFHRGSICLLGKNSEILYSEGDPQQLCYPRSAMKFFQVLPLIENGGIEKFGFTLEEIAIMCGSHNAEPDHLRVVRSILSKTGLTEEHLLCGAQAPTSKRESDELIRTSRPPRPIHNNCSGKHAGMLALSLLIGAGPDGYTDPTHPVQQLIMKACAEMYAYPQTEMVTALDGCSAPIFSIPVYNQALGFRNLADPSGFSPARQFSCRTVVEAVSTFPFMVAGSGRYCTDMMAVCAPHVIGKTGAEGIFCLAFTEKKIGVCIKIDDGKMLPQYNVAQALLEASEIFLPDQLKPLHHYMEDDLRNFNRLVTGRIKVRDGLFDGLGRVIGSR